MEGDAAYPINGMQTSAAFDSGDNNDLIWSPNSVKTSQLSDMDWTNSYGVLGLPGDNLPAQTLTASGTSAAAQAAQAPKALLQTLNDALIDGVIDKKINRHY